MTVKILVIAEHDNRQINSSTYAVVNAGLQLVDQVDVIIIGYACQSVVEAAAKIAGVNQVWYVDDLAHQHFGAESLVAVLQSLTQDYTHLMTVANTFGRNFLSRLAAKLDVDHVGDVIQIIDANTFVRPIYAGNALIKVQSSAWIQLLTIRVTAFALTYTEQNPAPVITRQISLANAASEFVRREQKISARPDLSTARVVVAGGRGLQTAENFSLLENIAEHLQAALGATRAAVDAGLVPNEYQIGQTGRVVAPELYIAVGISGAIQHVAGMKDSKIIVAINRDANAPIFDIADYGLVGDLVTILPALEKALVELKRN